MFHSPYSSYSTTTAPMFYFYGDTEFVNGSYIATFNAPSGFGWVPSTEYRAKLKSFEDEYWPREDEELSPGDTALMDEYLQSFKQRKET